MAFTNVQFPAYVPVNSNLLQNIPNAGYQGISQTAGANLSPRSLTNPQPLQPERFIISDSLKKLLNEGVGILEQAVKMEKNNISDKEKQISRNFKHLAEILITIAGLTALASLITCMSLGLAWGLTVFPILGIAATIATGCIYDACKNDPLRSVINASKTKIGYHEGYMQSVNVALKPTVNPTKEFLKPCEQDPFLQPLLKTLERDEQDCEYRRALSLKNQLPQIIAGFTYAKTELEKRPAKVVLEPTFFDHLRRQLSALFHTAAVSLEKA